MAGYLGSVPVPQATQHRETFTATAGQTTFNTAGYTPLFVDVYLNGVHLSPADITATNGSDVVLAECVVNDIVDIVSYTPFEVASQTFTGTTTMTDVVAATLDISGNIDIDGTTNLDVVDIDGAVDMASTLAVGTRVGIGVAAHSSAGLNITTTNQHIRLNNGSELGVISVLSGGELDIWGNGDGESINFRTGSGNGSVVMNVVGNKVGIGTSSIDGTLHVHTASAGTVTASSQADDLVVESNTEAGITILSPDDQSARIRFSSPSTNTDVGGATIFYRQNINLMKVGTAVAGGVTQLVSGADVAALSCDANGAVTMPLQPAFHAVNNANQNNIPTSTNTSIIFQAERFDQNADFTVSTGDGQGGDSSNVKGIFTAPVTGKYQFSFKTRLVNVDTAASYYQVLLVTSNITVEIAILDPNYSADLDYFFITASMLMDMDANDTAHITINQVGGTAQTDIQNATAIFTGYLVA